MTLLSFIALAFGMAAATADRVPRTGAALIALRRADTLVCSVRRRADRSVCSTRAEHRVRVERVRWDRQPSRRPVRPLRGSTAARAPGICR